MHACGFCGLGSGLERGLGDSRLGEDPTGGHLLIEHEGEENVLRIDVRRPEGSRHLVGVEQCALRRTGQRGRGIRLGVGAGRKTLFDRVGDGLGVGACLTHGGDAGFGIDHGAQDMECVDLGLAVAACELRGRFDDLMAALAQQSVDVDGTASAGSGLSLEETGEELVERVSARACGSEECGQS